MIFQWLLTILITLNLAVSSVPRCGMLRHVVQSLLASHDQEDHLSQSSCHDQVGLSTNDENQSDSEVANAKQTSSISDIVFCPCELAKFSYIWIIFDFSPKINPNQPVSAMVNPWRRLLAAFMISLGSDSPPPRNV